MGVTIIMGGRRQVPRCVSKVFRVERVESSMEDLFNHHINPNKRMAYPFVTKSIWSSRYLKLEVDIEVLPRVANSLLSEDGTLDFTVLRANNKLKASVEALSLDQWLELMEQRLMPDGVYSRVRMTQDEIERHRDELLNMIREDVLRRERNAGGVHRRRRRRTIGEDNGVSQHTANVQESFIAVGSEDYAEKTADFRAIEAIKVPNGEHDLIFGVHENDKYSLVGVDGLSSMSTDEQVGFLIALMNEQLCELSINFDRITGNEEVKSKCYTAYMAGKIPGFRGRLTFQNSLPSNDVIELDNVQQMASQERALARLAFDDDYDADPGSSVTYCFNGMQFSFIPNLYSMSKRLQLKSLDGREYTIDDIIAFFACIKEAGHFWPHVDVSALPFNKEQQQVLLSRLACEVGITQVNLPVVEGSLTLPTPSVDDIECVLVGLDRGQGYTAPDMEAKVEEGDERPSRSVCGPERPLLLEHPGFDLMVCRNENHAEVMRLTVKPECELKDIVQLVMLPYFTEESRRIDLTDWPVNKQVALAAELAFYRKRFRTHGHSCKCSIILSQEVMNKMDLHRDATEGPRRNGGPYQVFQGGNSDWIMLQDGEGNQRSFYELALERIQQETNNALREGDEATVNMGNGRLNVKVNQLSAFVGLLTQGEGQYGKQLLKSTSSYIHGTVCVSETGGDNPGSVVLSKKSFCPLKYHLTLEGRVLDPDQLSQMLNALSPYVSLVTIGQDAVFTQQQLTRLFAWSTAHPEIKLNFAVVNIPQCLEINSEHQWQTQTAMMATFDQRMQAVGHGFANSCHQLVFKDYAEEIGVDRLEDISRLPKYSPNNRYTRNTNKPISAISFENCPNLNLSETQFNPSKLPHLKRLDLIGCGIEINETNVDTLLNCRSLRTLNVTGNQITLGAELQLREKFGANIIGLPEPLNNQTPVSDRLAAEDMSLYGSADGDESKTAEEPTAPWVYRHVAAVVKKVVAKQPLPMHVKPKGSLFGRSANYFSFDHVSDDTNVSAAIQAASDQLLLGGRVPERLAQSMYAAQFVGQLYGMRNVMTPLAGQLISRYGANEVLEKLRDLCNGVDGKPSLLDKTVAHYAHVVEGDDHRHQQTVGFAALDDSPTQRRHQNKLQMAQFLRDGCRDLLNQYERLVAQPQGEHRHEVCLSDENYLALTAVHDEVDRDEQDEAKIAAVGC